MLFTLGALAGTLSLYDFSPSGPFKKGLVSIFTGEGKGKTTAALGVVLRSLGHGLKVCIVAFMKGDHPYGEWNVLSKLPNVDVARFGFRKFVNPNAPKPGDVEQAEKALDFAREAVLGSTYDLVVLDEINVAVACKLVKLDEVLKLVQDKPPEVELILTGRCADTELIQLADLVTECVKIKHPYDRGIMARPGIEY